MDVNHIERLETNIVEILWKLEMIFPLSFFDLMEHFPIHLPFEAKVGGPVQYKWITTRKLINTNGNTEGITVGKKFKTKQKKKWWRVIFTNGITDGIVRRYFPESFKTVHFPIALLIVVLYGQNHRRIENSSVLFGGFLKKFN